MRRLSFLPFCLALTTGAFWLAAPTQAQQTTTPVPPTASLPILFPDPTLLVIPPPPGAKLRVEMDARSEDLLGMVKSFLKGIGETGEPITAVSGQPPATPNPLAQAISSGDLAAMLKDVNHVHFVVYEVAGPTPPLTLPTLPLPARPGTKKSAFVAPAPPPEPLLPTFDSNSFYESAFALEGAHRIMFADADQFKLLMVGFPEKRGFAFAVSGGGYVVVERSDGYPNLEVLSAFISHVTTAVLNSKTGKKMMDSTFSPTADTDKSPDPAAKTLSGK